MQYFLVIRTPGMMARLSERRFLKATHMRQWKRLLGGPACPHAKKTNFVVWSA